MKLTAWEVEFDRLTRSGHDRAVAELDKMPRHMLDPGNPNHPSQETLFGQPVDEFLARQYAVRRAGA
jgi:hypothetical protein